MSWRTPQFSPLILLALALATFRSAPARADNDPIPGSRYTSAAAAAMGEAYLPMASDAASSLFYNPAGIARSQPPTFEPINISAYGDAGLLSGASSQTLHATSLSGIAPTLQSHPGTTMGEGFSVLPTLSMRDFAFGVLYQTHLSAVSDGQGNIHYISQYQLIPTAGFGMRFAEGIIRIGYSLQWVNEAVGNSFVPSSSATSTGYNQNLAQGSGFSSTVGFAMTLPYTYLPALNIVARNVGNTNYSGKSLMSFSPTSTGEPAQDPFSLDASVSAISKVGNSSKVTYVLEERDLTNQSGISYIGRTAGGVEFSIADGAFLRGGFGDGYPAAGFGMKTKSTQLDFSWYSAELGQTYHSDREIRYMLQYQIRFF